MKPKTSPANLATVALLCSLLAGCGGGGDAGSADAGSGDGTTGGGAAGPAGYAVDTSPSAALPTQSIDGTDPAAIATAGALMLELVEEAEDAVDDVDDLLAAASRACSHGGHLTVTEGQTAQGFRTRLLVHADCRSDDDLRVGEVMLTCGSAGCTDEGVIRYGNGDAAFMQQPLDGDAGDTTRLWRGEVRFSAWNAARETGTLHIDLRQDLADRTGPVGHAALTDFRHEVSVEAGIYRRRYEGQMASAAFTLPLGGCDAPGLAQWSTAAPLQGDDDDGDRTDAGMLLATSGNADTADTADTAAALSWSSGGQVEAAAAGGAAGATRAYGRDAFERLCDL